MSAANRLTYRSIAGESELELLVSRGGDPETATRWVTGLLTSGESRPGWCRMALSEAGDLLAAQVFDSWSPRGDPGDVPTFVYLLGHTEEAAAVELLAHDLSAFDARSVEAHVVIEVYLPPAVRALRESQAKVLAAAGFAFEVDRVRLAWQPRNAVPRPTGVLTFQPAATFPDESLVEIFAGVGDGSVDHGMRTGRADSGRVAEAAGRLDRARRRDYPDDWFVVGVDKSGAPVGYVQSATVEGGPAILAEVGVVEKQRGHRYVDELLAYGTAVVLDAGISALVSDTDVANRGMRAAFARAGYAEFASRRDLRWRATR